MLQALQQFEEEKSWSGATIWKMICYDNLQIKVTRYNNLQKKEESSSATKKCGSREFKKYKNAKKNNAMQKMKIRMSGRN